MGHKLKCSGPKLFVLVGTDLVDPGGLDFKWDVQNKQQEGVQQRHLSKRGMKDHSQGTYITVRTSIPPSRVVDPQGLNNEASKIPRLFEEATFG